MKTVALCLRASTALPWIWMLGGSTPLASLVIMDLGRFSSWVGSQLASVAPLHLSSHENRGLGREGYLYGHGFPDVLVPLIGGRGMRVG